MSSLDTKYRPGEILKLQHQKMQEKNKNFSLRSFALFLNLSPSFLSHVLSGKKKLSSEAAAEISLKLKFNKNETKLFLLLVDYEAANSSLREIIRPKVESLISKINTKRILPEGSLSKIEWRHLNLLVCLTLKEEIDEKALTGLSQYLEIKKSDLKQMLKDLEVEGFITLSGKKLIRTEKQLVLSASGPNEILKKIHREYLNRAQEHVTARSTSKRYSVTEFVTIAPEKFEIVKEKLDEFLDELAFHGVKEKKTGLLEMSFHLNLFEAGDIFDGKND